MKFFRRTIFPPAALLVFTTARGGQAPAPSGNAGLSSSTTSPVRRKVREHLIKHLEFRFRIMERTNELQAASANLALEQMNFALATASCLDRIAAAKAVFYDSNSCNLPKPNCG